MVEKKEDIKKVLIVKEKDVVNHTEKENILIIEKVDDILIVEKVEDIDDKYKIKKIIDWVIF